MRALVRPGDQVLVTPDFEPRDKYDRLLEYVFLPNGMFINEIMIKDGYAIPLSIPPNTKYRKQFQKDFEEARAGKRGLGSSETQLKKSQGQSKWGKSWGGISENREVERNIRKKKHRSKAGMIDSPQTEVTTQKEVSK